MPTPNLPSGFDFTDPDVHANANCDRNLHTNRDSNADSNSNRDGNSDAHSYIYTKTYADSEEHATG